MNKNNKPKVFEVSTDCDVKASIQIAQVSVTSSVGTRRANDEACLSLRGLDGVELATFFTSRQLDDFITHLQRLRYALDQRNCHKIKCPF